MTLGRKYPMPVNESERFCPFQLDLALTLGLIHRSDSVAMMSLTLLVQELTLLVQELTLLVQELTLLVQELTLLV